MLTDYSSNIRRCFNRITIGSKNSHAFLIISIPKPFGFIKRSLLDGADFEQDAEYGIFIVTSIEHVAFPRTIFARLMESKIVLFKSITPESLGTRNTLLEARN